MSNRSCNGLLATSSDDGYLITSSPGIRGVGVLHDPGLGKSRDPSLNIWEWLCEPDDDRDLPASCVPLGLGPQPLLPSPSSPVSVAGEFAYGCDGPVLHACHAFVDDPVINAMMIPMPGASSGESVPLTDSINGCNSLEVPSATMAAELL